MGTTLTGTTPQDTYDSLIKVTDNGPLSGTLKALSDGLGNDSTLSLSTTAASIAGTLAVSSNATLTSNGISLRLGSATMNAGANLLIAGASSYKNWSIGVQQNVAGCLEFTPTATNGATTLGTTPAMVILDNGNVGIGTGAPASLLHISQAAANTTLRIGNNSAYDQFIYFNGGNDWALGMDYSNSNAFVLSNASGVGTNDRLIVTTAGVIEIPQGQIQFPATQVASANANTLDDYEEGTWTMGVSFGGASVGVTYAANTGTYTKIGRQVTVNGFLALTSKGSSSGNAFITGLPFTIPNNNANYSCAPIRFNLLTFANQFQGFGEVNTSTIKLEEITLLGVVSNLTDADFVNTTNLIVTLTYFV